MTEEEKLELEYLRYFYGAVDKPLGPASYDIYHDIAKAYQRQGNVLPKGYDPYAEEETD